MSTCVPSGDTRRRTTTSSRKPKTGVRACASIVVAIVVGRRCERLAQPRRPAGRFRRRPHPAASPSRVRSRDWVMAFFAASARQQVVVLGEPPGWPADAVPSPEALVGCDIAGHRPAPLVHELARRGIDLAERQRIDVRHDVGIGLAAAVPRGWRRARHAGAPGASKGGGSSTSVVTSVRRGYAIAAAATRPRTTSDRRGVDDPDDRRSRRPRRPSSRCR